jgi:allantoate deiminase
MERFLTLAHQAIARCRSLAECTEEPGFITRTFLSAPMHEVHKRLGGWMTEAGMQVHVDHAGNIRGCYESHRAAAARLYIGSHLDTVPRAGAFDGILGVLMGVALVEALADRKLGFALEVIGFSEEEGVRFGVPFIGSRAFAGDRVAELLTNEVRGAIRDFGLNPECIDAAQADENAIGYLEFHIEQGPVLESLGRAVAVVDSIAGQSRFMLTFEGAANHAGTTPMHLRKDALAAAAEWIVAVEVLAKAASGLVATVGRVEAAPGAGNVIAGTVRASLDVRHASDAVRVDAVQMMLAAAKGIADRRGIRVTIDSLLDQPRVAMNPGLTKVLEQAVEASGSIVHRMPSGAGHDAMIVAKRMPAAMLFVRSPGGISHHPDETVLPDDVACALKAGTAFLDQLEALHG